jgi:hypothetical protein
VDFHIEVTLDDAQETVNLIFINYNLENSSEEQSGAD